MIEITSKDPGVYWYIPINRWAAQTLSSGTHIGYYEREEDAISARKAADEVPFLSQLTIRKLGHEE